MVAGTVFAPVIWPYESRVLLHKLTSVKIKVQAMILSAVLTTVLASPLAHGREYKLRSCDYTMSMCRDTISPILYKWLLVMVTLHA